MFLLKQLKIYTLLQQTLYDVHESIIHYIMRVLHFS